MSCNIHKKCLTYLCSSGSGGSMASCWNNTDVDAIVRPQQRSSQASAVAAHRSLQSRAHRSEHTVCNFWKMRDSKFFRCKRPQSLRCGATLPSLSPAFPHKIRLAAACCPALIWLNALLSVALIQPQLEPPPLPTHANLAVMFFLRVGEKKNIALSEHRPTHPIPHTHPHHPALHPSSHTTPCAGHGTHLPTWHFLETIQPRPAHCALWVFG
jgi:hypothetical protein